MISRRPPAPPGIRPVGGSGRKRSAVLGLRIASQLFLTIFAPCSVVAQSSLFDYWAVDLLSSTWGPLRNGSTEAWPTGALASDSYRLFFGVQGEVLSVGKAARLFRHHTAIRMRQPLGATDHVLRVGATQDSRTVSTRSGGRYLETGAVRTLDLGVELRRRKTFVGDWAFIGAGSWNSAISWLAEIRSISRYHELRLSRWKSNPHGLRFTLPTETITDVAEEHRVEGTVISLEVAVPLTNKVRFAVGADREEGDVQQEIVNGNSFLTVSPVGAMRNRGAWISLHLGDTHGVVVKREEKTADLGGDFLRGALRGGRLFFGRWSFLRWSVTGSRRTGSHRWRLSLARDEMQSALSARLETWPFVPLWEQLGAIAFRYRASLDGNSMWARLSQSRKDGRLEWSVTIARHEVQANQEDWLVTSLGFSRAEQEETLWEIESLVLLGGGLSRAFSVASGTLTVNLAVAVPVLGRTLQTPAPTEADNNALSGQLSAGVTWAW